MVIQILLNFIASIWSRKERSYEERKIIRHWKDYIMSDAYHSIFLVERDNEMYAIGVHFTPDNEEEFVNSLRSDIDEFIINNSKSYDCDELTVMFSNIKYFNKEELLNK